MTATVTPKTVSRNPIIRTASQTTPKAPARSRFLMALLRALSAFTV
jgi:hypothetical protein